MYVCICVYIYIYIYTYMYIYIWNEQPPVISSCALYVHQTITTRTPNLPINNVYFRGFDSSIVLKLRCGILRPIGNYPEILSQAMLVRVMLVGRLGVHLLFMFQTRGFDI